MAGHVVLTFTDQPQISDPAHSIQVNAKYLNNLGGYTNVSFPIFFVLKRFGMKQATIGGTLEETAANYITAFNLDYRNVGGEGNVHAMFGLVTPGDHDVKVDITVNNSNWLIDSVVGINLESFVEYEIFNSEAVPEKKVTFTGYAETSTCESLIAEFNIEGGSGPYNAYIGGQQVVNMQASPLQIPLDRSKTTAYNISFTDAVGVSIGSLAVKTPPRISADKMKLGIHYTEYGAVISVDVDFISEYIMPLTYSLDGVNYIESNVFPGQPDGDYTVYVKDAFGCVTSKAVNIDGVSTITETNFQVSDINPIRYSLYEQGKKNRYNTLSHEQLKSLPYAFIQYFTASDQPITQFRTNAKYINIFALDCEGGITPLNPVKRSNHIGQQLRTTATQFSTEDGLMGVFFGVVDVLDPTSGEVLESKDFGYQVPQAFNKVDRLVTIDGVGTIPVKDITYNEDYESFVLVFNSAYTGTEAPISLSTTYNIQNYEIYEFVTDISLMPESFSIVIEAGKSAEDIDFTYMSERIMRTEDSDSFAEVIYWNTENFGGMNYATGVVHTLRLHTVFSRLSDSQTVAGYNGDVERYTTDNEIFDGEEFIFGYLSEEMARKLRMVLAHDMLFINGIHYRLGDEVPELNSRFTTNICELTAILRKGGDMTEAFDSAVIQPTTGEGIDRSAYELEQAISAARGKALILWKS